MFSFKELKAYDKGVNISAYLRGEDSSLFNTPAIIEAAYDLQAGSYYDEMTNNSEIRARKISRSKDVANYINNLCPSIDSFLKAGVGEASTLLGMLYELPQHSKVFGFDISWSRTAYARQLINDFFPDRTGVELCTGELEHLPFPDSSVNVVHTSHALEPNGGREKYILQELYRVCSDYLVLIEPAYEFANPDQQLRMRKHGYCTNLLSHISDLNFNLVSHTLLEDSMNPDNPSMMITIKKTESTNSKAEFVCPLSYDPLVKYEDFLYCEESMLAYPVLSGIPCLRTANSIVASKLLNFPEVQS